jgi:hypothetical protein
MRRPGDSPNFSRSWIVGMDQWMPDYQRYPDECASLIGPNARRAQKLMLDSWVCFCSWCGSVRSSVSAGRSRSRVRCLRHTQVHAVAFGRGLVESDIFRDETSSRSKIQPGKHVEKLPHDNAVFMRPDDARFYGCDRCDDSSPRSFSMQKAETRTSGNISQ